MSLSPENSLGKNEPMFHEDLRNGGASGVVKEPKYSVKQASKLMGIGQTTLRRIIHAGEIPVLKIGTKILLLEREMENYLLQSYGTLNVVPVEKSRIRPLPSHIDPKKLFERNRQPI